MAAKQPTSLTPFDRLVRAFEILPGVGKRSAERFVFHLLKHPKEEVLALADAIKQMKQQVKHCSVCFNLTESDPCAICADTQRDQSKILVVEQPGDVLSIETTGMYRGVYHVLMGRLAPLDGIGPGELNIDTLLKRARDKQVTEVILGTNPSIEGDGTALYISQQLTGGTGGGGSDVVVSRLARGMPTGSSLSLTSKAVLADAIHSRQPLAG